MIQLAVDRLSFLDGTTEDIPEDGVTLIVGPNNAGKSALLHEIFLGLVNNTFQDSNNWLNGMSIVRETNADVFREWFTKIARRMPEGLGTGRSFGIWDSSGGQQFVSLEQAHQVWMTNPALGVLSGRVLAYLDAMSRPNLLQSAGPREPIAPALNPIHRIWDDRELEVRMSKMIRRAFGFDISINRYSLGPQLLMGRPSLPDERLPPSPELLEQYAALRPLMSQGDGVRSFAGILVSVIASGVSVTLIDEPEAFLHPPQARLLGRYLVEETPASGQVIIATHSSEILEGVLNSATRRPIKIIRVSTQGLDPTRIRTTIPPARLATLWSEPLLRYSGMLNGLFHKGVVVCESDGDCRFYEAALDVYLNKELEHDLLFTHVGGKARLAQSMRELCSFGVKTAVIGDIDVLNERERVFNLVKAAGGNPDEFVQDLDIVNRQITGRTAGPTVENLREATKDILRRQNRSTITDAESKGIIDAVKIKTGWGEVKRAGVAAFEGDASGAIDRILENLSNYGIFLVPVGELERWFKDVNAKHGIAYVTRVLETRRHENLTPELIDFLGKLTSYFGMQSAFTGPSIRESS
ncbi:putative AbiEii toxin of type IV toxin-antitoxin system [Amycolatopsis sulphurea]|uniref:Putative AbiEii toxin of type IV toxin-antitoxin system n=1 Tax=Amycolatopsis sulphurea TaxID=76022 RepID=A0A2A9FI53_9PSEU|nr:ATP-binding protein [Amycolatopsis sulphurea]PFG51054.1 putative AbiEii toxin of type IV toxin-antitoxin system [Amycolatopsis sulphurea]